MDDFETPNVTGLILVVDDSPQALIAHRTLLARQFDVITAENGEQALELCHQRTPDLILLDIEMAGMDGIEVCRRLREWATIPIIFATAHEGIMEHIQAYDAGGDDLLIKPVKAEILLRKVTRAIVRHRKAVQLDEEKDSLQKMAMSFLSTMGQNGALLSFMRASVGCRSHTALAENLLATTRELGVTCSIMIRHNGGRTIVTASGEPTPIEISILEQATGMGRLFQFRQRLVVNYDRVSIIIADMPAESEDADRAGQLRDNIAILAEAAEALCDNVDMRLESMARAEQLQLALGSATTGIRSVRRKYLATVADVRMILSQLEDKVVQRFTWLGISHEQEADIGGEIDRSVRSALELLSEGSDFDQELDHVFDALRGGEAANEAELF